ncbi:MAG: penicillin-binding protein [Anaerolineales bacterium]|nr:penicillin-binding protein [Anaerolineales bacterium]MDW8160598.1 penicillin-binding protein [Anaerolineales bacterium]
MRKVNIIARVRHQRRLVLKRAPLPLLGWLGATLVSLILTCSIFVFGGLMLTLVSDLPPIEKIEQLLDPQNGSLRSPTRILDREGRFVIANLESPAIERLWLDLPHSSSSLPTLELDAPLARAMIAYLEPNFNSSSGLYLQDFTSPRLNTIAQRLAYDLLLWREPEGWRKTLRAKILGAQLDQHYGKHRILIWFLNSAKFGPLVYGAETASRLYFNKTASELNILEGAALVSILESPTVHPFNAPEVVRKRTGDILVHLLQSGSIQPEELALANLDKLNFSPPPSDLRVTRPVYVDLILQQLSAQYPVEVIERGGLEIISTLDLDLQRNLECTLKAQMSLLTLGEGSSSLVNAECEAAFLLPGTPPSSPIPAPLQSQALILDPTNSHVLAIASLTQTQNPNLPFEHLPLQKHAPGTLLSPFVYLAAFSRGIQPATLQWDIPPHSGEVLPNLNGKFQGPIRARIALANDYFVPARSLFLQIGAQTVLNVIQQLGIVLESPDQTPLQRISPTQFFFSTRVSVLGIAQGYQALANQGVLVGWKDRHSSLGDPRTVSPLLIQKVRETNGTVLYDLSVQDENLEKRAVISPQLAYLANHILSDEAARWPTLGHPNPFEIGRRSAAKLGRLPTANQFWAVGYTPQRLVVVWLGSDSNAQLKIKPSAVTNLWHALMQYSSRNLPAMDWSVPPGLIKLSVCDPSGMLPDEDCPAVVSEIFLPGFEPRQPDQLFQSYLVNEQTGLLATVFTPLESVKEQRYLSIPPEAQAWALAEGLPLPPKEYDVVLVPNRLSENVQIRSPQMLSYVRGIVPILGSASGEHFQYYRLQFGEGLFPRRWMQIGTDYTTAVKEGRLGAWNTEGLDGLYTLQLQVVDKESRVETALLLVIVDNTPPTLSVIFPEEAGVYSLREFPIVIFQIQAADNLGIRNIELSLDDEKIHTFTHPPYTFPWKASPGSHRLLVTVTDLAGNRAQSEVTFRLTQ